MLVLGPKKQWDLLLNLTINLGYTVVSKTTEGPRRYTGPWSLIDEHIKTVSRTAFSIYVTLQKFETFSKNDAEKGIHAFVTSRLDYCNALLSSYPDKALNKLQLVLNTAARILTRTKCALSTLASCQSKGWFQGFTANLQSITWACSYLSLWFGPAVHTYTYATVTRCRPPNCP